MSSRIARPASEVHALPVVPAQRVVLPLDEDDQDDEMCPDGDPSHSADQCHIHQCPNVVAELEEIAPWGTSRQGLSGWLD